MKKRMNTALIAILIVIFATVSCGKTAKEPAYPAGDPDEVAAVRSLIKTWWISFLTATRSS